MNIKLRLKRIEKGYTLAKLSKKVGCSLQTLSYYERGLRRFPCEIAKKIAIELGCSIDEIV